MDQNRDRNLTDRDFERHEGSTPIPAGSPRAPVYPNPDEAPNPVFPETDTQAETEPMRNTREGQYSTNTPTDLTPEERADLVRSREKAPKYTSRKSAKKSTTRQGSRSRSKKNG